MINAIHTDIMGKSCRLALLLVMSLCLANFAFAENNNWIGPDGGSFSDAANWSVQAPAAGVTSYVTNSVTNPFATTTTGLLGTIDLGGNTQTFSSDIDNVLKSGGTLKNGTYNFTSTAVWNASGYSYTFDSGAVVNVDGYFKQDYKSSGGGSFSITVKNGAELNLRSSSTSQLGRYKNQTGTLTIQAASKVTCKKIYVGRDNAGPGNLYVRTGSRFECSDTVYTSGRENGDGAGKGTIEVSGGSYMSVANGINYNCSTHTKGSPNTAITVSGNSTLRTKWIKRGGTLAGSLSVNFNNGVFNPNTANVNIFYAEGVSTPAYHITGGALIVSNTVGKVTIGSVIDGAGDFTLKGGQDLEFTAAPTYTGKTTVEEGKLTYSGTSTTGLVVKAGATFAYTKDIPSLKGVKFESGSAIEIPVSSDDGVVSAKKLAVQNAVDVDGVSLTPVGLDVWTDVEVAVMTAPSFTGTPVVPEGLVAVVKSNGNDTETLYIRDANFTPESEKPYYAVYTGAGDDPADYTDSANWTCYNADGVETAEKVPLYYTTILLTGETSFSYTTTTASTMPVLGVIFTNNVTLAANCDWTGFGTITIPEGLTIALNGKTLTADISASSAGTITGSGRMVFNIPSGTTYDTASLLADSTCGFTKSGAGTLVVHSTAANTLSNRALVLNAGTVRVVNDAESALTNPFAQGTTGIAGALDLGGATQTFTGDPDNVFNNGAVVSNGTLKLTSTADWDAGSKTITFGSGLYATCAARLWDYTSTLSPTIKFIDGCQFEFTYTANEHRLGSYCSSSHTTTIQVLNGASLTFKGTVYFGGGNRGTARVTVTNSRLTCNAVVVGGWKSSAEGGLGYLTVQSGSVFTCNDLTIGTSGYAGTASLTFANSTLVANRIVRSASWNPTLSLNNLTYVPKTSGKNLFENLSTVPITGTLTISNTVGNVTIGSTLSGAGAFKLNGGKRLDFTAAPTYTGATTIENGTLSFGTLSHSSKVLAVGANGVLATDASDSTWTSITFQSGAKVLRTTKDTVTLTAPTITGVPDVGEKYVARLVDGDSSDVLTIQYRRGLIIIVR